MNHFLARLVERARGTAPRVEPFVASRFAPTPIVEIASEVETPRQEPSDKQLTAEESSSPLAVVNQEAALEKAESKPLRESEKRSLPQPPEKLLVPMEKSAVDSTLFVRPSPVADQPVAAEKNGMMRRAPFTASRSKRPQPATPLTRRSRSFERDLLTPNEPPDQQAIVRVTIGRIDVRATPPAVPSRKSPTHSEPKLTLDAYLKSRREGAR